MRIGIFTVFTLGNRIDKIDTITTSFTTIGDRLTTTILGIGIEIVDITTMRIGFFTTFTLGNRIDKIEIDTIFTTFQKNLSIMPLNYLVN